MVEEAPEAEVADTIGREYTTNTARPPGSQRLSNGSAKDGTRDSLDQIDLIRFVAKHQIERLDG